MKQRIDYLDIAKGIAFLLVIYCHSVAFSDIEGVNSQEIRFLRENGIWYSYFFIPTFFVVSGFFVNTKKQFVTFLWQNFKLLVLGAIGIRFLNSLIVNTVALHPLGIIDYIRDTFILDNILKFWGLWFLGAIFTARIIYFVIARVSKSEIVLAFLLFIVAIGGGHFRKMLFAQHYMVSTRNGIIPFYLHRYTIEKVRFNHETTLNIRWAICCFIYSFTTIRFKHYR